MARSHGGGFGLPKHQTGQVGVDLWNTPSQLVGIAPFSDFMFGQNVHASDVGSDQKRAHRGVNEDFHGEVSGLWLSRNSSQVENAESGEAGEGDLEKGFISQQYSAWSRGSPAGLNAYQDNLEYGLRGFVRLEDGG